MTDARTSANVRSLAALGLLVAIAVGDARADRIVLRGGGQIRGKVTDDPAHPDRVLVLGEKGKTPLSFQKAQIVQVVAEPGPLDEYLKKRADAPETAEGQFKLGLWCERYKLVDLASVHFEAAVRLDRSFAPAHEKLGHARFGDRWLAGDELREAQGLVRYKGKWITKEEKERHEEQAAVAAEQASWARRIHQLRQAMLFSSDDRRREAERQLLEIREPVAVKPLVRVLGDESAALRSLLDHALGAIPGPEAASALVQRVLVEADSDVRNVTLEELGHRSDPNIIPGLVRALRSSDPKIVNRAAWTLGNLNAVAVVPRLIPALVTSQTTVVMAPSSGGSGGGGISAGFASVSSIPVFTPQVVGPGAVGFGASAYGVPAVGSGFSTGGSSAPRATMPRLVTLSYQNTEVLGALVKLTGRDYGFDIPTWQRWASTSFRAEAAPKRQVPQP